MLKEILLKAIELENSEHSHDTLWVTDIAQCLRRTYYQFRYPLKPEYQLRRSLIIGKAIHLWIEHLLDKHRDKLGVRLETEVPVQLVIEGMVIRGYADIVLDNVLVELKTTGNVPSKPYFHHMLQAGFYAYVLGKKQYCIAYIGDYRYREFCMETDKGIINIFRERIRTLKKAFEEDKPPPREKSGLCNYCPYRRLCNRDSTLLLF